MGRRPPPPSRLLRPRGRPALAPWRADTAARALARPRGLALQPRADVVGASCEGPHGRPRHGRHECALPDVVRGVARHPLRGRLALGRHAVRRVDGVAVGRRGARLPHPPRDVEHQLAVSCLRPPSVRHDRSEHERRPHSLSSRWASRGTTGITRSPGRHATECSRISGTPRHARSGASSSSDGPPTCTGRRRARSRGVDPQPDLSSLSSISADSARIRTAISLLHSSGSMCPAFGNVSSRALGMRSTVRADSPTGTTTSAAPASTSTGTRTCDRARLRSIPRRRRAKPRRRSTGLSVPIVRTASR